MKATLKRLVQRRINRLGYDLRSLSWGFHDNPFADAELLLGGVEVRTILDVGGNCGETALDLAARPAPGPRPAADPPARTLGPGGLSSARGLS